MAYRVMQWGTGAVGKHTLRAVLDHPQLELAGCRVRGADKADQDAGVAAGIRAYADRPSYRAQDSC